MTAWQAHDITVNDVRIHYTRTGGDKPPLVLCHGFSGASTAWVRMARLLQSDYDIVMPDACGHGRSEPRVEKPLTSKHLVDDLVGLIQALGFDETGLAGHSMGANTVARVAAERPDLVRYLILEDPAWREPIRTPEERVARGNGFRTMLLQWRKKTVDEIVAEKLAKEPAAWDEEVARNWAEAVKSVHLSVFELTREKAPIPWIDTVRAISCPTLLVTGSTEAGAIVTPEVARRAAELNDNVSIAHIPRAGHAIRRTQQEPYVQAVTEFLAEASGRMNE